MRCVSWRDIIILEVKSCDVVNLCSNCLSFSSFFRPLQLSVTNVNSVGPGWVSISPSCINNFINHFDSSWDHLHRVLDFWGMMFLIFIFNSWIPFRLPMIRNKDFTVFMFNFLVGIWLSRFIDILRMNLRTIVRINLRTIVRTIVRYPCG